MKVFVTGSNGFIGKNVVERARQEGHEVFTGDRRARRELNDKAHYIDMADRKSIAHALREVQPEVVIHCAGVVENSENASLNKEFTANLLNEIIENKIDLQRVIILGSAAEYGVVGHSEPVSEDDPHVPSSAYGRYKAEETNLARAFGEEHDLPVTIVRPFNPIGNNMHPRMLIPNIIQQIKEIKDGKRNSIEISRLDSARDYIHVKDVASAIVSIATGSPKEPVYNVGLGKKTTNKELIDLLVRALELPEMPTVEETASEPEVLVAANANTEKIKNDIGWTPEYSVKTAVEEIVNDSEK